MIEAYKKAIKKKTGNAWFVLIIIVILLQYFIAVEDEVLHFPPSICNEVPRCEKKYELTWLASSLRLKLILYALLTVLHKLNLLI